MKLDFLNEFDFFTGVPDSLLKPLCNYIMNRYGIGDNHIVAANEGNAVGIAAGYYLSTKKIPVVYMQNSGIGNIVNPVASLMNDKVYGIPCLFIVGWRGEPGVHDEPQHIFQGEITVNLLENIGISTFVIEKDTNEVDVLDAMARFRKLWAEGKQTAFVVRKGAFEYDGKVTYSNNHTIIREKAIEHIVSFTGDCPIVSTTGKASRELFEIREKNNQNHDRDFLTVGSMGHSSSIALGIAKTNKDRKVWIIDGDGAVLMHMGAMAVLGASNAENIVHIVINNGAHETVGGMPTVMSNVNLCLIGEACGYKECVKVNTYEALDNELERLSNMVGPVLLEIECALGAREDLGRPTTSAKENRDAFMKHLCR